MMDNLSQTQRKIVIGVIAAVGSAVIVTVLVVAALLLRRRIKDKKQAKKKSHENGIGRKRFNSVGSGQFMSDGTQTPPAAGTAYHSNSFGNIGGGPSIVDLKTKRSPYVKDTGDGASRGLPLPRGPTPLVDIPYRDTRLPSSEVHYTFDGRVHLPDHPVQKTKMSRYNRDLYHGAGRYPFHKRDSYEYGRYMPGSYPNSDEGSKSSGGRPSVTDDLSRPSFQDRYTSYDKWPSWSRDEFPTGQRNVKRNSRSDGTTSSPDVWTDLEDTHSNTDSVLSNKKIPQCETIYQI